MKKLFLSLVAAIVAATATYAQSSLVATLSHEGETTDYYGPRALIEAHKVAVDGDVITLSSGAFSSTGITKAITLRGNGMCGTNGETAPTVLQGDFSIQIPETTTERLIVEGIFHDGCISIYGILNNPSFIKCRLNELTCDYAYSSASAFGVMLFHCKIIGSLGISSHIATSERGSVTAINSYINSHNKRSNNIFTNCILANGSSSESFYSTYTNCIFNVSSTKIL